MVEEHVMLHSFSEGCLRGFNLVRFVIVKRDPWKRNNGQADRKNEQSLTLSSLQVVGKRLWSQILALSVLPAAKVFSLPILSSSFLLFRYLHVRHYLTFILTILIKKRFFFDAFRLAF